jgi:hypothetical protein
MVRINVRNRTPATRFLKTHLMSNGGAHGKSEIKKKLQIHRKVRLSHSHRVDFIFKLGLLSIQLLCLET